MSRSSLACLILAAAPRGSASRALSDHIRQGCSTATMSKRPSMLLVDRAAPQGTDVEHGPRQRRPNALAKYLDELGGPERLRKTSP